jgi:hypothetical protein
MFSLYLRVEFWGWGGEGAMSVIFSLHEALAFSVWWVGGQVI